MESKCSCGLDDVSSQVIKACGSVIVPKLTEKINASILNGVFPDALSMSKVIPLFKSGDRPDCSNYCPILLLIIRSKIFVNIIHKKIYNYLEETGFIHINQFCFRTKHNTIDATASFVEKIRFEVIKKSLFQFSLIFKRHSIPSTIKFS